MKKFMTGVAILALTAGTAHAVGMDRSQQDIGLLFADGNTAKVSYGSVSPSVSGTSSSATGNMAESYTQLSFGYKTDINDSFSAAVIIEQPFGAGVNYNSSAFNGTKAAVDSKAISLIGQYNLGNGTAFHAGLRHQTMDASITMSSAFFGALNGYSGTFDSDSSIGYLLGASYERPEIALRVALTYFSEIDHDLPTTDGAGNSVTTVTTPSAWNLDFQTGVAEGTLVFGSIRRANWGDTTVAPAGAGGTNLLSLSSGNRFTLGVGRTITENFAMSATLSYEASSGEMVSPLAPTDGNTGITIGGRYQMDNVIFSGGVNYTKLGDATIQTGGTARGTFSDNSAKGFGFSVAYEF